MEQRYDQDPSEELEQPEADAPEEEVEEHAPQAPALVRIRLNGKTVEVPEDVADAIQARESDFQRQISKMGSELGQLRRQAPQEPQRSREDEDVAFFQSPSEMVDRRVQEAEERAFQRAQAEQQRTDARRQFWGSFYGSNTDLKAHEELVEFVFQKNWSELQDLTPAAAQRELASRTKALLGGKPASNGKPLPKGQAQTERPSNPTPKPQRQGEPSKPEYGATAAFLAKRAENRRRALYNLKKDED